MKLGTLFLAVAVPASVLAVGALAQENKGASPKAAKQAPEAKTDASMLKSNEDKASYFIGRNVAQQVKSVPFNLSKDLLVRGILDELADAEMPITTEQVQEAMAALEKDITAGFEKKAASDKQFLAANAKKEGVKTTKSGLQYKVIKKGTGATPGPTDVVTTHYEGRLVDGTVFDSSIKRGEPASFPVNRVIPGWTEALQLMKVGDKWQLYIPTNLAYDKAPQPGSAIYPGAALIFDIELLDVKPGGQPGATGTRKKPADLEELPQN